LISRPSTSVSRCAKLAAIRSSSAGVGVNEYFAASRSAFLPFVPAFIFSH
jgi:hypothetical protein